jgi:hypothetical protein
MRSRWVLPFLLAAVILAPLRVRAEEPAPQWVVVTVPAFRAAVEPLCEHRKSQGFRVVAVHTTDVLTGKEILAGDARKLRDHVNKLCRDYQGPSSVLLVGAVEAGRLTGAENKVLPPLRGRVSRMKGEPSDNGYGCPGDGLVPTVAVGRFPARSEEECRAMVAKTLAHERDDRPGAWRRRLTVLAGVPAFNPLVDKLVEGLALARFDRIDPCWCGQALYHNEQSRFCVPDDRLHDRAVEMVQEGQAFTLYLGHSNAEGLWGGRARYLDRDDWASVKMVHGGIFATFGCLGCQLSGPDGEGYGLAAVRNPNGPVAVLGSHGICFAAMVELAADGLFESLFTGKPPDRLGDAWLCLKSGLASRKVEPLTFRLLDTVDGDAKIPLAEQRLEHVEMLVLLGDPALRLPTMSADVRLTVADAVAPGKSVTVQGEVPARLAGAKVRVTLERPPSSEPDDLLPLPATGGERSRAMLANHEKANRFVLASAEVAERDGRFEVMLPLPKTLPWKRLLVRAYAGTERQEGIGVLLLPIPSTPAAGPP